MPVPDHDQEILTVPSAVAVAETVPLETFVERETEPDPEPDTEPDRLTVPPPEAVNVTVASPVHRTDAEVDGRETGGGFWV